MKTWVPFLSTPAWKWSSVRVCTSSSSPSLARKSASSFAAFSRTVSLSMPSSVSSRNACEAMVLLAALTRLAAFSAAVLVSGRLPMNSGENPKFSSRS